MTPPDKRLPYDEGMTETPHPPPPSNYYAFQEAEILCPKCGWSGLGKDSKQGETYSFGCDQHCPRCTKLLTTTIFPTGDEVRAQGSNADKTMLTQLEEKRRNYLAKMLKTPDQLPDILGNDLEFILTEENDPEGGYRKMIISCNGTLVWSEPIYFEYFERLIAIGKILMERYGTRMIDLIPNVAGTDLYGDALYSTTAVNNFRKTLPGFKRKNG